jgi:hypothetical protein
MRTQFPRTVRTTRPVQYSPGASVGASYVANAGWLRAGARDAGPGFGCAVWPGTPSPSRGAR